MTDPEARLATALADRYRIERELGQGGMATVYLAEDVKHQRKVALKVLKPELAAVLGAERFLAEIRVTANLQHPNRLPLFDSGEADGFLYYVMPYVEGETLRARLERERELPVDDVVRLVTLLAAALDYAHAHAVIHRDLKPENILLQAGQPVIADFGIALAVAQAGGSRVTETGLSLGTPHYMSPEQAAGERTLDARSDQYALGAVTFEMLSGEPPHTGPTAQAIMARLMTETPRSLRATRPEVPVAMDRAVGRALARSPADRFPSCGALAGALVSVPASRPRGWLAAGAVAALAVVATVAWVVTVKRGPASAPAADTAKSIAVLPLVNVGGDSTQEYFADGMADELANALGKVPGMRVAARTSSFAFKGQPNLDVREVGDKLGVAVVLQGSVRRAGEQMRVSVQLIDARERLELWSGRYDRPVKDAFAVQDSITQAIVSQLALTLGGAELAATRAGRTSNPEAHDLYLQGLAVFQQGTEPAIAARSTTSGTRWPRILITPRPTRGSRRSTDPGRCLHARDRLRFRGDGGRGSLEARQPGGGNHVVLGYASYATDWELGKAEREMRLGVALSPNSSWAAMFYGNFLCGIGRIDAGLAQADRAIELDRLSPVGPFVRGWCLYLGRRYDAVIARYAGTALMVYLDTFLGATYREQGRYQEALAEYARAQAMSEQPLYGYAVTYARMGRMKEAREILGRLEAYAERHYVNPFFLAAIRAGLCDKDRAFESLEQAARDRTLLIAWLNYWPELDSLHSDPRFAALGRRLGLPGSR